MAGSPGVRGVVLALDAEFSDADVPYLAARLGVLLFRAPGATAACDVAAISAPNLDTVNALARLQIRARALGAPLALVNASSRLLELLDLCGLSAVLPVQGSADDVGRTRD